MRRVLDRDFLVDGERGAAALRRLAFFFPLEARRRREAREGDFGTAARRRDLRGVIAFLLRLFERLTLIVRLLDRLEGDRGAAALRRLAFLFADLLRLGDGDAAGALGTAARRRALRLVERLRGFDTLRFPVLLERLEAERDAAEREEAREELLLGDFGTDALRALARLRTARRLRDARGTEALRRRREELRLAALLLGFEGFLDFERLTLRDMERLDTL